MASTPPHHHPHELANTSVGPQADPAQESLVQALRASFNILRVLMVVLVVLYIFSGVFRVEPGQQGLVARLGKLIQNPADEGFVFGPGWYFRMLPDPFDQKYVITGEIQQLTLTTFMFAHDEAATAKDLSAILRPKEKLKPGVDGAMFTGDRNLSHGRWEIQYRIDDAARFVQNVGESPSEFAPLLQRLTEMAVVREVAGRTVEQVTRQAIDSVARGVERRLQISLRELDTGVTVVQVVAATIEPGYVHQAFLEVNRAENEKLALIRQADERATEILNRAAGDQYPDLLTEIRTYGAAQLRNANADKLDHLQNRIDDRLLAAERKEAGQVAAVLRDARADANEINAKLEAEYEEFTKRLEERHARPRITLLGLWADMRADILDTLENEVFYIADSDEIEILVNRDVLRQRLLEEKRTIERQLGPRNNPGMPPGQNMMR